MGTILQFPKEHRPSGRDPDVGEDHDSAAAASNVLLFTGVRYERQPVPLPSDMPPDPPTGPAKPSKKRRPQPTAPHLRAK